jgi:hypothetical protein
VRRASRDVDTGLLELPAQGEIAGEHAEADGDLVGMQTIADVVIEVMTILELVEDPLEAPALAVGAGELLRTDSSQAGGVDPWYAPVGGRAPRANRRKRSSQGHGPSRIASPAFSQRRCCGLCHVCTASSVWIAANPIAVPNAGAIAGVAGGHVAPQPA